MKDSVVAALAWLASCSSAAAAVVEVSHFVGWRMQVIRFQLRSSFLCTQQTVSWAVSLPCQVLSKAYRIVVKRPFEISLSSARFMLLDCQPRSHTLTGTPVTARLFGTILPLAMDESQRRRMGRCLRPSQGFCLTNDDLGEGQLDHRCRVSVETPNKENVRSDYRMELWLT